METSNPIAASPTHRTFSGGWYAMSRSTENPDETEVSIYDAVGSFGIRAADFVTDLRAIDAKTIRLRVNSPGGEVFDATAIYNALREHPARVVVHVDGLAASAGSVIAMAGDEVRVADNAYLMIHEARGGVMGDAEQMRNYAGLLEKMNDNIAAAYQRKTGKPRAHWRKLMAAETWFTAKEAKAEGLADAVYAATAPEPSQAAASAFDFRIYNKVPADVIARFATANAAPAVTEPVTEPQITEPAQEPSPRGDATPPENAKETSLMANDPTQTTPASTPAAGNSVIPQGNTPQTAVNEIVKLNQQAIQGYIDQGRTLGRAEGVKVAEDRMRAIVAACPGRADLAVNAFLGGQDAATVAMIASAEAAAEARARAKASEAEVEIARLNAVIAAGGHPGVAMPAAHADNSPVPSGLEPEAQAKLEWDSDPMLRARNGNDEKKYLNYRVNVLKGNVRVLKTA